MSKCLLFASIVFYASLSFASPQAGDTAVLAGTIQRKNLNRTNSISWTRQIISIDASKDSAKVLLSIEESGSTILTQQRDWSYEELKRAATIAASSVANCSKYPGIVEHISVPAGKFETCKITTKDLKGKPNGYIWFGNVIFGIVRQDQTTSSGDILHVELASQAGD